jgi:hypothetical protein
VDRIADGRAYRVDLPSHMHTTFHVSLLKQYLQNTKQSHILPAPMPDL